MCPRILACKLAGYRSQSNQNWEKLDTKNQCSSEILDKLHKFTNFQTSEMFGHFAKDNPLLLNYLF